MGIDNMIDDFIAALLSFVAGFVTVYIGEILKNAATSNNDKK